MGYLVWSRSRHHAMAQKTRWDGARLVTTEQCSWIRTDACAGETWVEGCVAAQEKPVSLPHCSR